MKSDTLVKRPVTFGSFTINRLLKASPERVYSAWSTEVGKKNWFKAPNAGWEELERKFEFRIGGNERLVVKWDNGTVTDFASNYRDIVPNERIVYVYDLSMNGKKISVSLATIEFRAEGLGTRMTVTEHGAYLDGYEDAGQRELGTNAQMDTLEATLEG